jgi:hypothetical protein
MDCQRGKSLEKEKRGLSSKFRDPILIEAKSTELNILPTFL